MTQNIEIKNTLLYDVIRLFAAMASADGKITAKERTFTLSYFNALYPADFAEVLFHEFEKSLTSGINLEKVLSGIHRRLSNDEKIFLVVKLVELMAADEIADPELKMIHHVAEKLHIPAHHIQFFINILESDKQKELLSTNTPYKVIRISDDLSTGDVVLPFQNLKVTVVNTGKSLIILQKDDQNKISVNDKPMVPDFITKIPKNGIIRINNKYDLSYQDLTYYFKNLNTHESVFFLEETNKDVEICLTRSETSMVLCERKGCRIYLTPLSENRMQINGQILQLRTLVNFDDEVFLDNYKINLRTLVFQSFFQFSKTTRLSGSNIRKFTIGNTLESTIMIDDELDKLWDCQVEYIDKAYFIHVKQCPHPVFINDKKVFKKTKLNITDQIRVLNSIVSFNPTKRVFEKRDFGINVFEAQRIKYRFSDNTVGVNNISFANRRGELVGIMGTSGCGKTTLLNILNGYYKPQQGKVLADGYDIHAHIDLMSSFMSYVPQDDLLCENLTVYENLCYNAKLRFPGKERNHDAIVNRVLNEIGLYEKRDVIVGDSLNKILSGGERKRVNIGLELLSDSNIILLDEPTSGLSSKDSERILKLLQNLSFQGKIIYVVIHQPSVKLYEFFNKLILLDKGGKLAYFGSPFAALEYFRKYSEPVASRENKQIYIDPDFLLDTVEQQISDIDGTPLPIRKYSPDFWQEEFEKHVRALPVREKAKINGIRLVRRKKTVNDRLSIALTLLQRNFVNKLRDKSNLVITFLLPPLLGLFVGGILRYAPGDHYTFFENRHIGTFLFLSVLISIFLGITSSVEEIIKDQHILFREKMLKISNLSYFNAKVITLLPFAFIQNLLFVFAGYFILEGKEFYFVYTLILLVVSFCGISIGLLISSIPGLTSKAAINIIPIILIPQIVFGGALIKYEEMNKQLVFDANSPIPEICQFIPSRWGFESLITWFGYKNRYREIESLEKELDMVNSHIREATEETGLEQFLESRQGIRIKIDAFKEKYKDSYGNRDIGHAIKIDGNLEYKNFVEGKTSVYPMFIGNKRLPLFGREVSTPVYNVIVLILMSLFINFLTLIVLKIRFR